MKFQPKFKVHASLLRPNLTQKDLDGDLTAYFLKNGNVVSTETCKLTLAKSDQYCRCINVSIADGNHSSDFDRIDIVYDTSLTLISLYYTLEQYRQGYGTIETTIRF